MRPPHTAQGYVRMPDAEFEELLARAATEGARRALANAGLDGTEAALDRLGLRAEDMLTAGKPAKHRLHALQLVAERFAEGRSGIVLEHVAGGWAFRASRAEAAALLVLFTIVSGSVITYVIVPQPSADGRSTQRSGWSAALGFFASLPIAYLALVIESQFLKPLLIGI